MAEKYNIEDYDYFDEISAQDLADFYSDAIDFDDLPENAENPDDKRAREREIAKRTELIQEFAHVERCHLIPGLFQSVRGTRSREAIKLDYELPNGTVIKVRAVEPLTPFDLTLLCLIICKAAQRKVYLRKTPKTENGRKLRADLELKEDSVDKDCLTYTTSSRELIEELGHYWHGSTTVAKLEESLERMFSVSFIIRRKMKGTYETDMFHLISRARIVKKGRSAKMMFAINPILAIALIKPGHFARINMETLRELTRNPSQQIMYVALCNAIDPGKKRSFEAHEIRKMIYGPPKENESRDLVMKQASRAKQTLENLILGLEDWDMTRAGELIWVSRKHLTGIQPKRRCSKKEKKEKDKD